MRKVLNLIILLLATPAIANESSNPAFLGVGMNDMGPNGPCTISNVTPDSGADLAGVRIGDIISNINTAPITNCDTLVKAIQGHEAGVHVKIEAKRNGITVMLEAMLPSRADVLRKRLVGKPMPLTTLVSVEDQTAGSLSSRGKITIVGLFDQRCVGCNQSFSTIQAWAKTKGSKSGIQVMGVTAASYKSIPETVADLKTAQRSFDVPLLVADSEKFGELSINDNKRIHFIVIDGRGIVSYVTALKPDADDRDAVLGELYAATENAARRTR